LRSATTSAALRSRTARLAAHITGSLGSASLPVSERCWRTASSTERGFLCDRGGHGLDERRS
jgi:hypothetical protein